MCAEGAWGSGVAMARSNPFETLQVLFAIVRLEDHLLKEISTLERFGQEARDELFGGNLHEGPDSRNISQCSFPEHAVGNRELVAEVTQSLVENFVGKHVRDLGEGLIVEAWGQVVSRQSRRSEDKSSLGISLVARESV